MDATVADTFKEGILRRSSFLGNLWGMPHDWQRQATCSWDWLKQNPHHHTRGSCRGSKSTWQGIYLVETTMRCDLEARQMREKGTRAH